MNLDHRYIGKDINYEERDVGLTTNYDNKTSVSLFQEVKTYLQSVISG